MMLQQHAFFRTSFISIGNVKDLSVISWFHTLKLGFFGYISVLINTKDRVIYQTFIKWLERLRA
jgi:hypothetical protein